MVYTKKEFQKLSGLFNPIVGDVVYQSYFSYLGVFKDNIMFALYKDQKLYFRNSHQYAEEIKKTIPLRFLSHVGAGKNSKVFYYVPADIVENLSQYSHWITSSIQEFRDSKAKAELSNKNKIRYLPNMNIALERLLNKVGIRTVEDFKRIGELSAFVKLVQYGSFASETLLFKLYGAVRQKYIYTLSEQEKKALLADADLALYNAGLRKRFIGYY